MIALKDVANVIRSKNAGPFELTLDILLKEQEMFEKMRAADIINKQTIAQLYQIPVEDVLSIVYFPNARPSRPPWFARCPPVLWASGMCTAHSSMGLW